MWQFLHGNYRGFFAVNFMYPVDLHVHTTASDGDFSPREVVALAKEKQLTAIAITDHDSVAGIQEAMATGISLGVHIIPGIELSVDIDEAEIHILGYLINYRSEEITSTLNTLQRDRFHRVEMMVERLNQLNYSIKLQDVLRFAGQGSPGRLHIAKALLEKDLVPSIGSAFKTLLARHQPAYVIRDKLNIYQAINLIQTNGGLAVLAHPGLLKNEELVTQLCSLPIQGIEVFHPENSPKQRKYYLQLCEKWNFLATGGSDFHGPRTKEGAALGATGLDYQSLLKMYQRRGISLTFADLGRIT